MKKRNKLILQQYMAEHIKVDQTMGFDNLFESFSWEHPDLAVSKNDFISEMLGYCDSEMINVLFEFESGLGYIKFEKSENIKN